MFKSHKLNQQESETINTILDQEERNIDQYSSVNSTLSNLDDQCRQIWPNWDTFSPPRGQKSSMQQPSFSESQNVSKPKNENYYQQTTIFSANAPTSPKPLSPTSKTTEKIPSYKVPNQLNSQTQEKSYSKGIDLQNIKSDIDSLYTRIHTMSTGSRPQVPQQEPESPTLRSKIVPGTSPSSVKNDGYNPRYYSSQYRNLNVKTPSRKFLDTHTEAVTQSPLPSQSKDFSMNSGYDAGLKMFNDSFDVPQVKIPSSRGNSGAPYKLPGKYTNDSSISDYNKQMYQSPSSEKQDNHNLQPTSSLSRPNNDSNTSYSKNRYNPSPQNYPFNEFSNPKYTKATNVPPEKVQEQLKLLRDENFKLRTELMKVKKRLQIEQMESQRLEAALQKSTKELQSQHF